MAGAAPAAAAATASEHTRGTLVWVRPAAAAQHAAGKTAANAGDADAEEWVKATVARVLDNGATLEVELEGGGSDGESSTTITVSAADAPLQNPASRLGVEVREKEKDGASRASKNEIREKAGAPFFLFERRERPSFVFLCLFSVRETRHEMQESFVDGKGDRRG